VRMVNRRPIGDWWRRLANWERNCQRLNAAGRTGRLCNATSRYCGNRAKIRPRWGHCNTNRNFARRKSPCEDSSWNSWGEVSAWCKEIANPTAKEAETLSNYVFAGAPGFLRTIGGATSGYLGKLLVQCVIMLLSLYFFLIDGGQIVETLMRLSPLDDAQERELLTEFERVSRAVVLATILSAVIQGLLAGLGFWVFGVGMVFLLSTITILFALIPFVGAASVWFPACLWLYLSEGRPWAAVMLAIYGSVIVSTSDNVVKPLVLHGQSNLHPLLALLSVLGGCEWQVRSEYSSGRSWSCYCKRYSIFCSAN